uniref:Mediator of RNA polymerase II transcription subunit 13 n=1 Tax=Meloidogyne incognita TaxID=6306 RepID=A0A914LHV8_MELIC
MSNGSVSPGSSIPTTSLEDCSTNIFQIAEINGLKWCCFTSNFSSNSPTLKLKSSTLCADIVGTDNADPVLRAYIDCLEANLLCTWRRRPPVASTLAAFGNPIPRPDAQKELWIFWYTSEEPKLVEDFKLRGLNVVTHSEATDADAPRVEFEYETRTLFFKSLNSAIERRLLSEGFVRFGRWLCRPLELSSLYAEDKHTIPKFMNAIRFHYFLHRDSLVCASIVVQRQPAILRLSQCHFKEATQSAQPVILAPWSIRAQLLPNQQDFVGDFDTRKTPVIPSPSNEEGPSFLSSTLSPEKNDGGGTCPKRRLSQLVESHWKEWKRIYPALELLTTNSNGNKSSNAANNKRRTSSGVISSSRSNSLSSIPRMVVIQLGGQFVLYPSAFVGILVDELICPLPFKTTTSTSKTDEATCSDILVDNILDQSEKSSKSFSSRKSDFQTSKIRRHIHTGLSAARASYGLGCLRNPKNRVSAAEHSDPFNCDLQQQRASDCMAEFGYDYMRREFCYCRICPQLGRAFSSVQSSLAESQKESQTCQTTLNSLISNNHHQQPKVSFHRIVSDEGIQSNGDDYLNVRQHMSNFSPKNSLSHRARNSRPKCINSIRGSSAMITSTSTPSHSRWMDSLDNYPDSSKEYVNKISFQNKGHWDLLNMTDERSFSTISRSKVLLADQIINKSAHACSSNDTINSASHCDIRPSSSFLYQQLQPSTCTSELERMILGDDDDDDSDQQKVACPVNEGDPLGLLQRLIHQNLQQNLKWRKRKRKWNCVGSSTKKYKRVAWPTLSSLELLNIAFTKEESNVFSNDPYSLLPMLNPEVNHSNSEQLSQLQPYAAHQSFVSSRQPQSMLMKLLLSPSAEGMDAQQRDGCLTEAQTHDMSHNQHQNSVMATIRTTNITEGLTTLSQQQIATTNHIIDEHMDEYAVTPPALLDSDTSLLVAQQQQMADQEIKDQQGLMMNISLHEMNFGEEVHACGHSSPDLYSPPSTTCNTLQTLLQHQQQHTPQNTMLSPPASNEQVDSVNSGGIPASQIFHGGIPTTSNFTTTCMNQPTYSTTAAAAANAILQESMSKIYPTPPTPAQQFSPQNILLFSHHHLPHQFQSLSQSHVNSEQAIVSVLGYFAEQLHNLPWEEPIYELSNHHKSHARHFCKNMLSVGENNLDDRLNDVSCAECSSILNALENQNQHNRLLKRDCCDSESVEKITPNFILKMPTGVGTLTAIQLHALAQRRTKADSQLEYRLQLEEHARFRILVGNNSSEFVPQWPGGNWHDNLPQVPPFPHIPSLHPQGIRNFGPSFPIFQGSVQPILSHNEQLVDGNSPVTPFYHQSVAETPQQQMLSRQISFTNSSQMSTQLVSPSLTTSTSAQTINHQPAMTHCLDFISSATSGNKFRDFLLNINLCNSSLFTLLIQDTIADLHYDIVFDACPLCCCNSNIRSFELGFYITGPKEMLKFCDYLQQRQRQQQPQALLSKHWSGFRIPPVELQKCICGFSAVRHRYLCGQGSGLFQEDIAEALGVIYAPSQRLLLRNFNTNDLSDCKLMDLIRHLVISRDVASLVEGRLSLLYSTSPEYLQSSVDSFELNALINGIMGVCGILQERQKYPVDESFLHPWGYQSANSVGEPRDTECLGIFDEVCDIMRDPSFPSLVPCFSSNGRRFDQLSLRIFARIKNVSLMGGSNRIGEEENGRAEPIPKVVVLSSAEREPLLLSPTMIRNWEQLELMPIDQPKDVLYLALVPDVNVLAEKCKIFLEELGSVYERRCRLGSHIRLSIKDAPKDAILRVGRSSLPLNLGYQMFNSLPHSFFTQFGFDQHLNDPIIQKFASYMECCNQELQELAKFLTANDSIFERRALLESIFRQQHIPLTTSLASPPDASAMPPPAMPGGTLFTSNGQSANVSAENGVNSLAIHQHPSPLSTPGFANQQQSPAGGSGPNSVPILHGNVSGDCLNATAAMSRTPSGIESVEELAKMEDKLIKDMREQVDLLLSKEEQARRLQMPHVLVIYLINPFGQIAVTEQQQKHKLVNVFEMSTEFSERFEALATAAFLRAWNNFLSLLNFNRRSQLQLELLPLRKVYDYCAFMGMSLNDQQCNAGSRISAWDELRRLSFSIYTQPRLVHLNIAQEVLSKSMTKFGTAEKIKDIFLTLGDNMFLLKQNCSPFLLAPERNIHFLSHGSSNPSTTSGSGNTGGSFGSQHSGGHKLQLLSPDERILFLAYCLIADGKWLCASVTDERGSLLDTTLINLNVPSEDTLPPLEQQKEWKHKERHSQIADALQRLWLFVRSVMLGQEVHQWRLVINRMGKLGHTEFKIWNDLLSKRSLKAYNSSLKNNQSNSDGLSASTSFLNNCLSCSNSHGSHETPAILSACLVSTEGEPHLRVFGSPCASANSLDTQSPGNVGVSNTNSNTSNVIGSSSTSNIGNSASTKTGGSKGAGRHSLLQAQQWAAVQQQLQASPDDRSLTHIIVFPTILNVSCQQQEDIMHGGIDDDVFADFLGNCFGGEGAPDGMELVEDLVFDEGPRNEEEAPIDNQPMAIGYTITTAPVWPLSAIGSSLSLDCGLSDAFWYNCPPAARYRRLTHLKSSLHINSTNLLQTDDYQQTTGKNVGTSGNQQSGNATTGTDKLAPNPLDLPNTDDILR